MEYTNVTEGIFLGRNGRFVADVKVNDIVETTHIKNTGQCGKLLYEGAKVFLEESSKAQRKTKYDLFAVSDESADIINIDQFAQTQIVRDFIENDNDIFPAVQYLQDECEYEDAKFDYYFDDGNSKVVMNVCSCIDQCCCMGLFPETVNAKEVKRVKEITEAYRQGYEAYIGFVIHISSVDFVIPNRNLQPEYADALHDAVKKGVKLLFFRCDVTKNYIKLRGTHIIDRL